MNKLVFISLFLLSCGGGGSVAITNDTYNRNIQVVIVKNNNFYEMIDATENAMRALEVELPIKFNITAIHEIDTLTEVVPWNGYEGLVQRGEIAITNNPVSGFSLIIDRKFEGDTIAGLADGICSSSAVVFADTQNPNTEFLIAHELGHMIGLEHNECEDCLMRTTIFTNKPWRISERNQRNYYNCRNNLENFNAIIGSVVCEIN